MTTTEDPAAVPTEVSEETAYLADRGAEVDAEMAAERAAETAADLAAGARTDGSAETLIRAPTGRLVPDIPLDRPIAVLSQPFRRGRNAEPAPRWAGVFLGALAVLFVPYLVVLAMQLPDREEAAHYAAAWVGLDVMELLALAATAYFVWRRSTFVAMAATAAATLLVCDAWFDTVTARQHLTTAILEAVLLELPMAGFCLWIGGHAEVVADRATRLLLRRSARQAERLHALQAGQDSEAGRDN